MVGASFQLAVLRSVLPWSSVLTCMSLFVVLLWSSRAATAAGTRRSRNTTRAVNFGVAVARVVQHHTSAAAAFA